jgi:glycosyltransferase involved in cell wall biosynthesis
MSENYQRVEGTGEPAGSTRDEQLTDRPAVGVLATPDNAGDVVTTVLQSRREGYEAVVCHYGDPTLEAVQSADQLGATTVQVESHDRDTEDPEDAIAIAARTSGFPGVIFHTDPGETIDFAASERTLTESNSYVVESERAPEVSSTPEVLVAIPAYNEEDTVGDVVREARQHADEVVVVDDGSSDATVDAAKQAGATVIEHVENKGYGSALQTAFQEARRCHASHLAILDADGQHEPSDVPKLVEKQREQDAELVIGSRLVPGAETDLPLYRRFGLGVVNLLTNLSFGVVRSKSRVRDTQSGFRVYDQAAIESLADADLGSDMSASTDILQHAHSQGYEMIEVGTAVSYEVENGSAHHPVNHGIQLVSNLLRTIEQERPITALGLPGFISAMAGLGFGYWTFSHYISTGNFPLGLAITSAFFGLAGIFACFTAIILHSLKQQLDV